MGWRHAALKNQCYTVELESIIAAVSEHIQNVSQHNNNKKKKENNNNNTKCIITVVSQLDLERNNVK